MIELASLLVSPITDKESLHGYLTRLYPAVFGRLMEGRPIKRLLEIGVYKGGSLQLWKRAFPCATVIGIEIEPYVESPDDCLVLHTNGYADSTIALFEDNFFDIIIDDGPHTVQSQIAVWRWAPKVRHGGAIVIEDIEREEDLAAVVAGAPEGWLVERHDTRQGKHPASLVVVGYK